MTAGLEVGYFESGSATLDYARRVDDAIESLNARISEARARNGLHGFPWEDWIDFKRTWAIFRDDVFDSWITWGMYDSIANYHRQLEAWKRLFNKLSSTKDNTPKMPIDDDEKGNGFGLGSLAIVGGIALALGMLWTRRTRN